MDDAHIDALIDDGLGRFRARTGTSRDLWQRALDVTPHGVANSLHFHDPYPLAIDTARGAHVVDLDGTALLDLHRGHGVMVCGHAEPHITDAIVAASARGAHTGAPSVDAVRFMEILSERFAMDHVQLCVSGAEATSLAIRIARAATDRRPIIKVEGGYHGAHEPVMVSTLPDPAAAGAAQDPIPVAWGAARPDPETRIVAFNDLEGLARTMEEYAPAALIIEPILLNAGFILPQPGYLDGVRALCTRYDVILIADEVKTGAAIAHGGAMRHYGVTPDLLCLGKGIGGGMPIAAVGGRRDLMRRVGDDQAPHYSTFAAGPVACAAGIAALEHVLTPEAYVRIGDLGDRLAAGLEEALGALGATPVHAGGKGTVIFGPAPTTYREFETGADLRLAYALWLHLFDQGVLLAPVEDELQWTLCTAHTDAHIDQVICAAAEFARRATR